MKLHRTKNRLLSLLVALTCLNVFDGSYSAQTLASPGAYNLLRNPYFESQSASWRAVNAAGSVSYTQYHNPARAHDGAGFLEMNTRTAGGSVAQDVAANSQPGQSYSLSVWVRAAPGTNTVSGAVALWALGGLQENSYTEFTVGQTWTQVTVPLDVTRYNHRTLRAEIYMGTTGANFDVDGAVLINAGFRNASFESSATGWRAVNVADMVSYTQLFDQARAHDGAGFLEMNTRTAGGSVAQDVAVSSQPGQSYSFSVWLRAAPDTYAVSGAVALWALGGVQENSYTEFTVGQTWTQVTVPLDVTRYNHRTLRAEIYMGTTGANFDVDGAVLINAGFRNASFESSATGWHADYKADTVHYGQYIDPARAHDGSGFLEMNTRAAGGSVAQDLPIDPWDSYETFLLSVWVRAAPGTDTVSGAVVVTAVEQGVVTHRATTGFTVGQAWTKVSAPLPLGAIEHNSILRSAIYMNTAGVNYYVDGAVLTVVASPF